MTTDRDFEAIVYGDGANQTAVAWAHEGEISRGTVADLADYLSAASATGDDYPRFLYAPTASGKLVPVPFEIHATPYSDDDLATATVTVRLSDEVTVTASWTIDGRA